MKNKRARIVLAAGMIAGALVLIPAAARSGESIPNVIIVTFEGVRNSETIDDPTHQYIPRLWDQLRPEGTLYTNLVNENCEFHMPSVQAINTGDTYEATWGILNPTIFHYVKQQYGLAAEKLWMIGHWFNFSCSRDFSVLSRDPDAPRAFTTLQPEVNGRNKQLQAILSPPERSFNERRRKNLESKATKWPVWDSMGPIYFDVLHKIMRAYQPKLIHYLVGGPECAHYGNYARYVMSIKSADEEIARLWTFIQTDPFYKDNTYLFVCVDHPRDAYYRHHNNSGEPVWLYVYGPDIKRGESISRQISHPDIFATVARLMRVRTHETAGAPLADAFLAQSETR